MKTAIMDNTQKFRANSDYTVEKFDDEILLYAVSTTKGVYLNDTAHLIWEMCTQEQSVEEIILALEKAYPSQLKSIRADVPVAVRSLVESGALIPADD
jgi:hypothetical protein